MFGLARVFLGAAARRGVATTATATAERGLLGRVFGFAGRHPVMTTGAAVVADQRLNDGRGTSAAFDAVRGAVMPDFANMDGGDWMQMGAALMAGMGALNGNLGNAAMLGVAAYFMDDILEFVDNFLESQGIDIIPDSWYQDEAAPAAAEPAVIEAPTNIPAVPRNG